MLMPETQTVECPGCRHPIQITVQSEMRARTMGTALSCSNCGQAWLLRMDGGATFLPLSATRPPSRRGPPRLSRPSDLDD